MPFLPNVPHIVGDDDESNETQEQAEMSNASTSTSAHALSSRSLKTIDSESSDASESSYEDKSEAEYVLNEWFACSVGALISNSGEESSGSTGEEDWSNNISYIVRIPKRDSEPDRATSVCEPVKTKTSPAEFVEENSMDYLQADNDQPIDLTADFKSESIETKYPMEDSSNHTSSELVESKEPSSSMDEDEHVSDVIQSPYISSMDNDTEEEEMKVDKLDKCSEEPKNELMAVIERRKSLRSVCRTTMDKSKQRSKKTAVGRQRKFGLNTKESTELSIGARVAKRLRNSVAVNRSPMVEKSSELAKPLEVTEYFTKISATLVSHRVNLLPFLHMRKRIDRLVGEAIAKTKIIKKTPIN